MMLSALPSVDKSIQQPNRLDLSVNHEINDHENH